MFDTSPIVHPDDEPDPPSEAGPWVALLVCFAVAWACVAFVEWRLLTGGTLLWATAKNLSTLVFAPLTAAVLLQDTRALGAAGTDVGVAKWAYAGVALFFPPVSGLYLCHRHLLLRERESESVR